MAQTQGKIVAITGASSGIGEATARHLAGAGMRVVMGARRGDRLSQVSEEIKKAGGAAAFLTIDVTKLEDLQHLVAFAQQSFGGLDVIINDAGIMTLSKLEALKIDEWNRMLDVNVRGLLHGIAAALPLFRAQKKGHFINVASTAGHQVTPTAAVYAGTKSAVLAISEGLRQELAGEIRVTVVTPGVVSTELESTTTDPGGQEAMKQYRKNPIPPEAIARAIAFAIEQPDDVTVSEIIVRPT